MAKLLITGGAGYVGSHAAKLAAASGHDCVVYDSLVNGHRDFVRWGPLVVGDIRDGEALDAVFRAHRFDAVMHFAALAYVGQSVTEPGRYYDVNVGGSRALLDTMVRHDVRSIVFSSTCATYGQPQGSEPIREDTPAAPINPYGYTKLAVERMLADFEVAYGVRSVKLRYFNAAGADPDGQIGEHHEPETHLIPLVLDAALGRRAAIQVFGSDFPTEDGTCVRDYVHVCDLANAHVRALDRLLTGGTSLAVNLGTGRGNSVAALIAAARKVTGRPIREERVARRPGDPSSLVADARAAQAGLGWSPVRSGLEQVLADAWRWQTSRFGRNA